MPTAIFATPDTGASPVDTATVPAGQGWTGMLHDAQALIVNLVHQQWLPYAAAGLLAALLALSVMSRRKRGAAETRGDQQTLTRTDRAITRITGILATAVVALGAWKVFGDVLHLHWFFRGVLFFFAEAQIIAAWRRVRRHIHRHAALGKGIRTIYGIAFGSATVAAFDAGSPVEVLLRFFAAGVAAYMVVEELAEELDIYLTAHPAKRTTDARSRSPRRINWTITPERIFVWLRLADPNERQMDDVVRQQRIARFARTAYRLHLLREHEAAKWRIRYARWQLRRQTESGNEHLNLASDTGALMAVRIQLALLYGAEDGTSRKAVSDLWPLRPPVRFAISDKPFMPTAGEPVGEGQVATVAITEDASTIAEEPAIEPAGDPAMDTADNDATDPANDTAAEGANPDAAKDANPVTRRAASRRATKPATEGAHPTAVKLAKFLAKYPHETNADLAKRMRAGDRTVSRYRAAAEAIVAELKAAEKPVVPPTFDLPKPTVTHGVNGYHPTSKEHSA